MNKTAMTLAVIISMCVVVLGVRGWKAAQVASVKRPIAAGKTFGVQDAPVKIEEFTDFQCPSCAKAAQVVHERIKKDGSRIFFEFKYFPLAMHAHARRAAVAAQCALDQGRFWPMQERLFATQDVWSLAADPTDYFLSLARSIGADDMKMMRCMSDKAVELKIDDEVAEGKRRSVNATPTFFVNGKMAVGTLNFEAELNAALK